MNVKSARMLLGAAVALYFLWVGYSDRDGRLLGKAPPERIIRPVCPAAPASRELEARRGILGNR